jgi:hypothetical protein
LASEAHYEPFFFEFTPLKYSIDKFEPDNFGSPIKIETDFQALHNCLLKNKMNSHYSHWQELIFSHNIVDIGHCPGINNPVVDGLSRMLQN